MKNLFKKSTKKVIKTTIQKLDKNQLEKVVGGTDVVKNSIQDESKGFSSLIR